MLGQAKGFLHTAADPGQAVLQLLVTVTLGLAAGLVAPVMLVAALGQ